MEQINSETKSHENDNRSLDETYIKENEDKPELEKDQSGLLNQVEDIELDQSRNDSELSSKQQTVVGENSGKIAKLQFLDELNEQISSQLYSLNKKALKLFLASLQLRALEENKEYCQGVKSVFEGNEWSNLKRQYNKKHQQTEVQEFTTKRWICDLEEEQRRLKESQNSQKNSLPSYFHNY